MDNQHEFRIGNYVDYFHETVDRWVGALINQFI